MLSKEDLLVMSYNRSKAGGDRQRRSGHQQKCCRVGMGQRTKLTLSISVICVGHTAEAFLSCSVPDLGRQRGGKEQG